MKTNALHDLDRDWLELEATGIPLEPRKFRKGITLVRPAKGLFIRQEGDDNSNAILVFENGSVGFILTVFIRRDLPGKIIIQDSWLKVPWHDKPIGWLPDPADDGPKNAPYTLDREDWRFLRKEVLNHRLKGNLYRGDILFGTLLAKDGLRPPKEYREGGKIRVTLNILDQWDHLYSEPLELWLIRFFNERVGHTKRPRVPLFPASAIVD